MFVNINPALAKQSSEEKQHKWYIKSQLYISEHNWFIFNLKQCDTSNVIDIQYNFMLFLNTIYIDIPTITTFSCE